MVGFDITDQHKLSEDRQISKVVKHAPKKYTITSVTEIRIIEVSNTKIILNQLQESLDNVCRTEYKDDTDSDSKDDIDYLETKVGVV